MSAKEGKTQSFFTVLVTIVGFAGVFYLADSGFGLGMKLVLSTLVVVSLLGLGFLFNRHSINSYAGLANDSKPQGMQFGPDLDEELATLSEAAVFFSASIKSGEMLRLLETRLSAISHNCEFEFFVMGTEGRMRHASRANLIADQGVLMLELAERTRSTERISSIDDLRRKHDSDSVPFEAVAFPLFRAGLVFCVLGVSASTKEDLPGEDELAAIAERVTPLISSSLAFESSLSNALTDTLTNLPNERALYLVLENQVAEAQRFGTERNLSVLAVDLSSFDEINQNYGHIEGDKVLSFAGRLIRHELRKMDFLARTSNDEFYVILPTASGESAKTIVERIQFELGSQPYDLPDGVQTRIRLSFGIASFGDDGDTASKLIRTAAERKQVAKQSSKGTVLVFPKENL